jgi:putative tryptophan/tyrosine transport system substrate-binding protein
MNRRAFVFRTGALFGAAFTVQAQQPRKQHRVAILVGTTPIADMTGPEPTHPVTRAFLHELRVLGYIEGRNLILERWSAEGKPERYSQVAAEVVRLKPDVVAAGGSTILLRRLKEGAGDIPIVMIGTSDPVELGLVASLARPGGNITGVTSTASPEIEARRLQLLKEVLPKLSRVAYFATKEVWELNPVAQAIRRAAPLLGLELLHALHVPADIDASLAALARLRPDALVASNSGPTYGQYPQIVRFAVQTRLPGVYPFPEMAETGGLMSYGVSLAQVARQVAQYVDKILRGAKPGDLPVEHPTKYDLVINLKTAGALGLTIPRSMLLQAERVIE